jgi:hypothetical protein
MWLNNVNTNSLYIGVFIYLHIYFLFYLSILHNYLGIMFCELKGSSVVWT